MFETRAELLEKVRLGEDSFLELKEVRFAGDKVRGPTQNDLADELAAFANTRGGVMLLGVENATRQVVGVPVERLDAVEALIRQACEDSVTPPATPLIERMTLSEAPVATSTASARPSDRYRPIISRACSSSAASHG